MTDKSEMRKIFTSCYVETNAGDFCQRSYIAIEDIKGKSIHAGDTEEWVLKSDYEALDKKWRDIVGPLVEVLEEIAIEQKFYIKEKDYFSEVVRLNLTAKEALSDYEAKVGK